MFYNWVVECDHGTSIHAESPLSSMLKPMGVIGILRDIAVRGDGSASSGLPPNDSRMRNIVPCQLVERQFLWPFSQVYLADLFTRLRLRLRYCQCADLPLGLRSTSVAAFPSTRSRMTTKTNHGGKGFIILQHRSDMCSIDDQVQGVCYFDQNE